MMPDRAGSSYVADILAHAEAQPARAALVRDGRTVTYGDLPGELGVLAGAMRASGVEAGARVGIVTRDPVEDVLARLAVSAVGAVPCSLDPATDAARRQELAGLYGLAALLEAEDCFDGLALSIRMDAGWRAAGADAGPVRPLEPVVPGAIMTMTSGTTGTPSAVVSGHGAIRVTAGMLAAEGILDRGTVFLNQIPHFTNAGTAFPLLLLMAGGTSVIPGGIRSLDDLVDATHAHGITLLTTPAYFLGPLVGIARARGARPLFPAVRTLMVGGDMGDAATLQAAAEWLSPGVILNYASTTSGMATILRASDFGTKAGSVGRPFPGVEVEIEGPDGSAAPTGTIGPIRLRTTMTFEEVLGPKKFNGEEIRDGYIYPGDVGRVDGDGYLFVVGRQSDVIARGGESLYPALIEARLRPCPGLREVVVVGVTDEAEGQVPVAFAVAGEGLDAAGLEAFARDALPEAERPARVVMVDSIPRNHLGKALRRELAARLSGG